MNEQPNPSPEHAPNDPTCDCAYCEAKAEETMKLLDQQFMEESRRRQRREQQRDRLLARRKTR